MAEKFLIYGATGYTGKLTARIAKERGLTPILSGRNVDILKTMSNELGFEYRAVSLDEPSGLDAALEDVSAVLHIAGPFSATYKSMLEACLRTGTHYVDINGEIEVMEAIHRRDAEARKKGIVVIPGAGFDVVPSDCVAAYLKKKVPNATNLKLSLEGLEYPSRGTLKSGVESIGQMVRVRRNGEIITLPKPNSHYVDFGEGPTECLSTCWSDVSTAYYTTGIPNIEVFFKVIDGMKTGYMVNRYLSWWFQTKMMQGLIKKRIDKEPEGPSDEYRSKNKCIIIGEIENDKGNKAAARLRTDNGYTVTALASLLVTGKVVDGIDKTGVFTPAGLFGPDLVLEIDGCSREDL